VEKGVDNEGNFVEKLYQLCKGRAHVICKFHYNCDYSFWEKNMSHCFGTALRIVEGDGVSFLDRHL
jgi:hypothetical protein